MRIKHLLPFAVLALILLITPQVLAASTPRLTGHLSGIELCPQSICGSADFSGSFLGEVSNKPTVGSFWTAVKYISPLPSTAGGSTSITGGTWFIWTMRGTFAGTIGNGGTITANGNNTFTVSAALDLTSGGSGSLSFDGTLNHNVFPPTIIGTLSQ